MSANSVKPSSSSNVIPWGEGTRSAARRREQQLLFEVLDNPSLREVILKHAIIRGDKKVDHRTACALRHVEKSWNDSVLRILWKAHEPLYKVVSPTREKLAAFTKTFAMSATSRGPPPPLKLDRFSRLSQQTNLEIFSNFMTSCGPALLQLELISYDLGDPFEIVLPPWRLSRLYKLDITVGLSRTAGLSAGERPEAEVTIHQEKIPERLINAIFLGATALAELSLSVDQWLSGDPTDVAIFESVTFPPTLVKISLEIDLKLEQSKDVVKSLLKCPLPNVTSLSFLAWKDVFAEGILFSLMDKWKSCLKNLVIAGRFYEGPPRTATTIHFPVMEELEKFSLSSVTVELESGLRSLERFFPKFRTLRLRHQTSGMLRKWTESSRFFKVTSLELSLADENFYPDVNRDDFCVSASMEVMQLVNLVFPNLRKLRLGISKSDSGGLWYVFQEMRQLEELTLKVFGDLSERSTDVWDSILTGVFPEKLASHRRNSPGSQESVEDPVLITHLKDLKSLSVENDMSLNFREYDLDQRSLISDFIFDQAFFKMPKLTRLHFEGLFKVSEEMTDKWMCQGGRSLTYQRFSDSELQ